MLDATHESESHGIDRAIDVVTLFAPNAVLAGKSAAKLEYEIEYSAQRRPRAERSSTLAAFPLVTNTGPVGISVPLAGISP